MNRCAHTYLHTYIHTYIHTLAILTPPISSLNSPRLLQEMETIRNLRLPPPFSLFLRG